MKKWILTASRDAINIDFETIIESDTEPGFWTCYELAAQHGCEFFDVSELLEYDHETADRCKNIVDVLTAQDTADLMEKPVLDGKTIYYPIKGDL